MKGQVDVVNIRPPRMVFKIVGVPLVGTLFLPLMGILSLHGNKKKGNHKGCPYS